MNIIFRQRSDTIGPVPPFRAPYGPANEADSKERQSGLTVPVVFAQWHPKYQEPSQGLSFPAWYFF